MESKRSAEEGIGRNQGSALVMDGAKSPVRRPFPNGQVRLAAATPQGSSSRTTTSPFSPSRQAVALTKGGGDQKKGGKGGGQWESAGPLAVKATIKCAESAHPIPFPPTPPSPKPNLERSPKPRKASQGQRQQWKQSQAPRLPPNLHENG